MSLAGDGFVQILNFCFRNVLGLPFLNHFNRPIRGGGILSLPFCHRSLHGTRIRLEGITMFMSSRVEWHIAFAGFILRINKKTGT